MKSFLINRQGWHVRQRTFYRNPFRCLQWICLCIFLAVPRDISAAAPVISGELKKWHRVTLTFEGPETSEAADLNPFRDYRLNVTFVNGQSRRVVPGFFAADGQAGQSSAEAGHCWRVRFAPEREGEWSYKVSFRKGADVAVNLEPEAGSPVACDGLAGKFTVGPTDKTGRDLRGKGLLRYVGGHYLHFAENGEYYVKGGADSPENLLGYADFDGTHDTGPAPHFLHSYQPHVSDWQPGDPVWQGSKGKGLIGALNYLSAKGMNSVYFMTYNIDGGDGKDTWPWISEKSRDRFDTSKLDQWELVFAHMDRMGLLMQVVTQETENDQGLNGGELGVERKMYYRELVARFAHHLAVVWNLGEENSNTDAQRKAFAAYIRALDPYRHPIVVHTFPGQYEKVYAPLLGFEALEGASLQMGDMTKTHAETLKWVTRSTGSERPWVVCLDEIGPAKIGVKPDAEDPAHDAVREEALWGNLMAGGGGCEWYFGYEYPNNDLTCEDWRSREAMWNQTRYALEFFYYNLPAPEMAPHDELIAATGGYCLAKPGEVYAIYLPRGGSTPLNLGESAASYNVSWFNPRAGGRPQPGTVATVKGPGRVALGDAPGEPGRDWAVLVQRAKE